MQRDKLVLILSVAVAALMGAMLVLLVQGQKSPGEKAADGAAPKNVASVTAADTAQAVTAAVSNPAATAAPSTPPVTAPVSTRPTAAPPSPPPAECLARQ